MPDGAGASDLFSRAEPASRAKPVPTRWRDTIKIHPAAAAIPKISKADAERLSASIKRYGLKSAVILLREKSGELSLLDGRSRLDAMVAAGLPVLKDGRLCVKHDIIDATPKFDAKAFVDIVNVDRRQLTRDGVRRAIEGKLKENPARSDRATAKELGVDHKTVAAVRAKTTGEIPQLDKRVGADGKARRQPAARKAAEPKAAPVVTAEPAAGHPAPAEPASARS